VTQDKPEPEMPGDIRAELGRLGRVGPPDPGLLDAAREVLWAAVAAEMLPASPGGAAGSRRIAEREADQPGRAGRRHPGDPGA
jgi:hypothetical protein